MLGIAIYVTGLSGAIEDCYKFNDGQNALEINCNDTHVKNCTSSEWQSIIELEQVFHLKMTHCSQESVQNTVKLASNLISIEISSSNYETLDSLHLIQHQLQATNASHNNFTQIPHDFFHQTLNIIELDFSYNFLERIESSAFNGASNLQRIHLSHNQIAFLADDAFTNLTRLQFVNLNGNQCHWIDMFRNNKQMRHLLIANNPIFNFDCNHFLKMSAITVEISWQDIRYFQTNCLGNQFNVFLNHTNHSDAILPAQREIYCNEQSFKSIQQFSAGRNKFENIGKMLQCFGGSALKEIDLSGNFVGIINRTVFSRFTNLEWISLSDTILLDFDFGMLDAQHTKLERLDVSSNNLMNLHQPNAIRNFRQLKQFIAAECQLRNAIEIISNLPAAIQYLDLSGNFIGQISSDTFQQLRHLHTLKLNRTQLSWPKEANPFEQCENLRILDISENPLADVDFRYLLATLRNLTDFSAANCQLKNAVHLIQFFSSELSHLDLSENHVGQLDANTFESLINLKTLSLSNVGLTSFDPKILRDQQQLRFLNISHNHLTEMVFDAMPKSLVKLDIEWNDLTVIWDFDRVHLPALESVSISKNRLQCSELHDLKRNWDGLKFSGDPMDQKYGNCFSDDEQVNVIVNVTNIEADDAIKTQNFSTHFQYSLVILAPIIGIVLTGCIGFTLYRQFEKFFKSSDRKINWVSAYEDKNEEQKISSTIADSLDHIYEEIDDCVEYDRLRFDTDPKPLTMVGSHYHNVNIRTSQNEQETKETELNEMNAGKIHRK